MGTGTTLAIELVFGLIERAAKIQELIKTAQAENRDVSQSELDQLAGEDDAARILLEKAVAKRKAAGG